ncbi:MarR family winged helix-turn-helix transcriptional regulator [Paenibacillus sp. CMAA1364]
MIDDDIRLLLGKLSAKSRKRYSEELVKLQLHVGQEYALYELWLEDGIQQSQLSERMGCEPPTVSNMLKKLEEYGLVNRIHDTKDARISRVYLTDKGKELQQPLEDVWQRHQQRLLEGIYSEEKLLLRRLLQQMIQNLNN